MKRFLLWVFGIKVVKPERVIRFRKDDKVICRSNEPGPYLVGSVIIEDTFSNSTSVIPTLRLEDGKEVTPFGIVHPYSEEKCAALDKLEWWEQWNVMATGMYFISVEDALKKG